MFRAPDTPTSSSKMSASKETSQAPAPPHPEDMCRNPKKEKGEINGLEMEMDCKWKWN